MILLLLALQDDFFEAKIRPLLAERCWKCHSRGAEKLKGDLYLDSRAGLTTGGGRGPALELILRAVSYEDPDLKMPPDKKLGDRERADLAKWIAAGAPWPGSDDAGPLRREKGPVTEKDRAWWAYQPVRRPAAGSIDALLGVRLKAAGLAANPPASRRVLIRRATYDLTGLPPSAAEIEAFEGDAAPDAYEKLLDRLLASPHYGEKWGRHWLDLVRFAETNGYERDGPKPNAWRYRDYVIDRFNRDLPYDLFIREQLAGDELPDRTADTIVASGFLRLGIWDDEPADGPLAYYDEIDGVVATTAQAFLAMTINCARCHDHKADPIPQEDYYRFLAFFHELEPFSNDRNVQSASSQTEITEAAEAARLDDLEREERELRRRFEASIADQFTEEERKALEKPRRPEALEKKIDSLLTGDQQRQLEALEARKKTERTYALSVNRCRMPPPPAHVLVRGNPHVKGKPVEPGFPQILTEAAPALPNPPAGARSSGRRLALADWIASPENRLTCRALANRLWQHHFGRGIVPTPNDFGKLGLPPTHPELLDWLAAELVAGGWRLKRMHKLIMTSEAYRRSSADAAASLAKDPSNELFWRFPMRRLTAEELRDSILSVSGELNPAMGGPSVYTLLPPEVLATASAPDKAWGRSPPKERARRSIYVYVKRSLSEPFLTAFDMADTDSSTAARFATTVPTQALTMINGGFVGEQAAAMARRLEREEAGTSDRVRLGLRLVLQRSPAEPEVRRGVELIESLMREDGLEAPRALESFCLMALNLNEFLYLD